MHSLSKIIKIITHKENQSRKTNIILSTIIILLNVKYTIQ
jgi:hypothetical protein